MSQLTLQALTPAAWAQLKADKNREAMNKLGNEYRGLDDAGKAALKLDAGLSRSLAKTGGTRAAADPGKAKPAGKAKAKKMKQKLNIIDLAWNEAQTQAYVKNVTEFPSALVALDSVLTRIHALVKEARKTALASLAKQRADTMAELDKQRAAALAEIDKSLGQLEKALAAP